MELWLVEAQLTSLNEQTSAPLSEDQLHSDAQDLLAYLTDDPARPTESDLVLWLGNKFRTAQPDSSFSASAAAVAADLLSQLRRRPSAQRFIPGKSQGWGGRG